MKFLLVLHEYAVCAMNFHMGK